MNPRTPGGSTLAIRGAALVSAMSVATLGCAGQAPRHETNPPDRSDSFASFVDGLRAELDLPGLAVVVAHADGSPEVAVSGVRHIGEEAALSPADALHIGSNGKALTASAIAALVERGEMSWELSLGDAFPELAPTMDPAYRGVTVRQLLAHAGGTPAFTDSDDMEWVYELEGTPAEQRLALARRVLAEEPAFAPGTKHAYSNAGVAIAGAVAERVTGRTWEELVTELVLAPLGARPVFGNPALDERSRPWGHVREPSGRMQAVAPEDWDFRVPAALAPAGDISLSAQDYGKFLQLHLRGLLGRDGILGAASIHELHTPVAPTEAALGWALGWGVVVREGVETHGHAGSAGAFIAIAAIQPTKDLALAILTNIGGDEVSKAVQLLRPRITAWLEAHSAATRPSTVPTGAASARAPRRPAVTPGRPASRTLCARAARANRLDGS